MGLRLAFEQGAIAVSGDHVSAVPHTKWDDRTGNDRALGFQYQTIRDHLEHTGADVNYTLFSDI